MRWRRSAHLDISLRQGARLAVRRTRTTGYHWAVLIARPRSPAGVGPTTPPVSSLAIEPYRASPLRYTNAGLASPVTSVPTKAYNPAIDSRRHEVDVGTDRMEAFSDGVIAILITIMVLDLKIPRETDVRALVPVVPTLLTYVLSFIYLGIYWNNHHHLLLATHRVSGGILWANLHLLFWLSLIPFTTGWMGENHFAPVPTAAYGVVLLMAAVAWWILQQRIIVTQGDESILRQAIGGDWKGKVSPLLYLLAIVVAVYARWISVGLYALVAMLWLIPDRRIERVLVVAYPKE